MSENTQTNLNPDYTPDFWDGVLKFYKKVFKSAELRHHMLPLYAVFGNFMPGKRPKNKAALATTIEFKDGSKSLKIQSPAILAAGSIKYGEAIPHLAKLGFGALSVGTATRESRTGNPHRPRVALIEADRMMHNSMGLNNPGVKVIAQKVKAALTEAHQNGLAVGISVSETPGLQSTEERLKDLGESFQIAYAVADYVEINLSCPNTGHERLDAQWEFLENVIERIQILRQEFQEKKAILAKLSPDLDPEILRKTLQLLSKKGWSGVILFNTWPGVKRSELPLQSLSNLNLPAMRADGDVGGLSGRKMYPHMIQNLEQWAAEFPELVFWGSGGIDCGAKVDQVLKVGGSAAQIYSVLGFRWNPIWKILAEWEEIRSK